MLNRLARLLVCTVAARYYTKRTDDLYRKCLRTAKRVAFDVMTKGYKSTEICQGFLLLCCWNQPAERFEEERTCKRASFTAGLWTCAAQTLVSF